MPPHLRNGRFPAGNPLANALVVIAGIAVLGVAILLGIVAFVALGSLLLVMGAIIGIRVWWLNRKLGRQRDGHGTSGAARIDVIEGEYREVRREPRQGDS